ncbi:MAG TPA: hypothetical protein VHX14_23105 [Thermoanaerobaculia bacterium]|nr:hypothetical protein [Thermoanaerobaculia bacterium]
MRTTVMILLTTAVALRMAGQAGPAVSPSEVTMRAGETILLHGWQHPGGFSCGFPYHYEFFSDMPAVATAHGFASGPSVCQPPDPVPDNGVVSVTAVAPGIAHVRAQDCCGDLSTITVLPRIVVQIHAEAARVLVGEPVVVTALVSGYDQTPVFSWYRGRMGDFSRPIRQSADPRLTFIGSETGVSYVWVQVLAGSVTSSAEIGVELVIPPRRRAAQH